VAAAGDGLDVAGSLYVDLHFDGIAEKKDILPIVWHVGADDNRKQS